MNNLQTQLEQSRLREAELLGALKEMQDKVLDLEKVSRQAHILAHEREQSVKAEQRQQACAAVNVLKMIL